METAQPMVAFQPYLQIPSAPHRKKDNGGFLQHLSPLPGTKGILSTGEARSEPAQPLHHPFPLPAVTSQVSV